MSRHTPEIARWRYWVVAAFFILLGLGMVARLFHIQVVQHESFAVQAQDQYGTDWARKIPATRGIIRSADGYDLAGRQPAYQIWADPRLIENPVEAADKMAAILADWRIVQLSTGASTSSDNKDQQASSAAELKEDYRADLIELLSNKERHWVILANKLDVEPTDRIKALDLKGVGYTSQEKRYYPEGVLASQVLGFVGSNDKGEDQGYYGIEGYFDQELRGKDGYVALETDQAGNPIPVGTYEAKPVEQGSTITLTINRGLQYQLEQKLKAGVERMKATAGSVILMEPDTGSVLAMANYPTYNPGDWDDSEVQDKLLFKNNAIQDNYEPGSVVKSLTVATGLETNVLTPDSTYLSAPYKVADHTINTADHKYYGTSTVAQMLQHSDNTGAAYFGLKIGKDNFLKWFYKVGLNKPTGITLQGEASGQISEVNSWTDVHLATAAFGQGVSVTPLQLLEMMATIANDGVQMKPTIIKSIQRNGQTTEVKPEEVGRVFSSHTSQLMRGMLAEVVEKGEFRRLALQGYGIAGKTGTAQVALPTGGYDPSNVITTFVGFAPYDKPKFIMLVKLDKPAVKNSAETVIPIWMNMATELLRYYGFGPANITPTPSPTSQP